MSDDHSHTEDSEGEMVTTHYTCRKCPGLELRTDKEKDEHRIFHRNERAKPLPKGRPGPKSKKRGGRQQTLRGGSPAPSSVTLFAAKPAVPAHRTRQEPERYEDTSAAGRRASAHRKYTVHKSKVFNRKNEGG